MSDKPKQMQEHTYAIMNRVEDSHWWFVGRRAILEMFLEMLVCSLRERSKFKVQGSRSAEGSEFRVQGSEWEEGSRFENSSEFQVPSSKSAKGSEFRVQGSESEEGSRFENSSEFQVPSSKSTEGSKFNVQSSKSDQTNPEIQTPNSEPETLNSELSATAPALSEEDSELSAEASGLKPQASALSEGDSEHALRILDVGCGTGANLEMLAQFGEAEGVDVSDEALEFCRSKGLKVHKGLAEELPFEDGEFDIVTALDVVEHLDDDIAGLREMQRVTKKGGKALFFVPAFMWLWGVQDDISHHRIRYTKKQIVERIEAAGFRVERAAYANFTFFAPILAGRMLMKLTGLKPASENNINISALNGVFGSLFSAERFWLKRFGFPVGVSIVISAENP